ncbi:MULTISPECIES: TIGR00341 family protein [unclassified Novosphingobium]|uniref:TIGR00341 family protein n=1 Tax=unclassified Novosphingobium TaxID=2644732 RepID=UPI0025F5775B|nr:MULTISPECIES: TIGR00341 family protein [unclassified Novosphingobium]HQV02557.1 TIGR00341 family protein [Novosphingobium sp.]
MIPDTPAPPSRLGQLRQSILYSFLSFRRQIDKTGLFPDLQGEPGSTLRKTVRDEGSLTKSYMLMCALSAGIATLGLLQSSTAVVIGAMLISPLMGPIAALGFGFASFDGHQIRDSLKVVSIGAAIGILTGVILTWLSPIHNATPEIIARTEPTLLDLVIAILSGIAGAYATVQQKGATVIGVAIATALMPPLATVGYGIGVLSISFAVGAFLLFLTNLAAIAFSFALIARFSGAARPLGNVELTPRFIVAGFAAFLLLATPLAVTLYRVTAEARAQATVRQMLLSELKLKSANIAQLQVKWPLRGSPSIDAVIVSPRYSNDAEQRIAERLAKLWGVQPRLNLQQVVAADIGSQTQAIVDSAVERSANGIARDVPPLVAIREATGLPTQALWVNRAERTVQLVPFSADGWTLSDYRAVEKLAAAKGDGWQVRIIPPVQASLIVPLTLKDGVPVVNEALETAFWAVDRWGVQGITVAGFSNGNASDEDRALGLAIATAIKAELGKRGITAIASSPRVTPPEWRVGGTLGIEIGVVRAPPRAIAAE